MEVLLLETLKETSWFVSVVILFYFLFDVNKKIEKMSGKIEDKVEEINEKITKLNSDCIEKEAYYRDLSTISNSVRDITNDLNSLKYKIMDRGTNL